MPVNQKRQIKNKFLCLGQTKNEPLGKTGIEVFVGKTYSGAIRRFDTLNRFFAFSAIPYKRPGHEKQCNIFF